MNDTRTFAEVYYETLSLNDRLMMDIRLRRIDAIKRCLEQGANPNYSTLEHGHVISKAFGEDPDAQRILRMLVDAGSGIDGADQSGNTLVHQAVLERTPSIGLLDYYIQQGCDLDRMNNEGLTPIGCAAIRSEWRCFTALQKAGCNLDLCAHKKNTSLLEITVALQRSTMASILLDLGVRVEDKVYMLAKTLIPALAERMEPILENQRLLEQASNISVSAHRSRVNL